MSFRFEWPEFGSEFHAHAARMLNNALNKGPRPKVIADDIRVKELNMGTIPPELDILEIGDLTTDRFRGIFRLTYTGDAHLILSTKVQANPLSRPPAKPELSIFRSNSTSTAASASRGILFAASPLIVPMHLRLSEVRLRAIVVLVVSKSKGVTLVFKNDPLESVEVSSTFDGVAVIQKYLQQEIEGQLREMFREDLPGIIHRLSQSWLAKSRDQAPATATNPHLHPPPPPPAGSLAHAGIASASTPAAAAAAAPSMSALPKASAPRPASLSTPQAAGSTSASAPTRRTRKRSQGAGPSQHDTPPTVRSAAAGVLSSSPSTLPPQSPLRGFTSGVGGPGRGSASGASRRSQQQHRQSSRAASGSGSRPPSSAAQTRRHLLPIPDIDDDDDTEFQPVSATRPPPPPAATAQHQSEQDRSSTSQTLRDIEEYDPTYGLRPDEVDLDRSLFKSGFSGLGRLVNDGAEGFGGLQALAGGGGGRSDEEPELDPEGEAEEELSSDLDSLDRSHGWARGAADPKALEDLDLDDDDVADDLEADAYQDGFGIDEEVNQSEEVDEDEDDDIDPFVSSAFGSEAASNTFGAFSSVLGSQSRTIFDKEEKRKTKGAAASTTTKSRRRDRAAEGLQERDLSRVAGKRKDEDSGLRSNGWLGLGASSQARASTPPAMEQQESRHQTQNHHHHHARGKLTSPTQSAISADRLSSPSRMSLARSLSGVGVGVGLGAAAGLAGSVHGPGFESTGWFAQGPGAGADSHSQHQQQRSSSRTDSVRAGGGPGSHVPRGFAPSLAGSSRSRRSAPLSSANHYAPNGVGGIGLGSASASSNISPSPSSSSLLARPRIFHVASRVQVPILDEDDEARSGRVGASTKGGGGGSFAADSAIASSTFDGRSSTRSSRSRGASGWLNANANGHGFSAGAGGTATVRAPRSTRTNHTLGGAGTTGTRTIRAPPSMGSSARGETQHWAEEHYQQQWKLQQQQQRTIRARNQGGAGPVVGLGGMFDDPGLDGYVQAARGGHRYENGDGYGFPSGGYSGGRGADGYGDHDDIDDEDDDDDLGRVSDLDDDEEEISRGNRYTHTRTKGHANGTAARQNPNDGATTSSTLSPPGSNSQSGTDSSILSGTQGGGGGESTSSEQKSLTTLEPTAMDPRSAEYKRQLYREQYEDQVDNISV
ncbi:hypothetical protein V8E36_005460 [Tilletia maclaganii]